MEKKPYIIGITGGSASGKTLFLKRLMAHFGDDEITLISQDNYYKPIHFQQKDENGIENFDIPESIDAHKFAQDIEALRRGETVQLPEYTFNNKAVAPKLLTFKPSPILVVEGLFVFHFDEVARLLDLRVFIDAKDKVKLKRRIQRDNVERGYDITDVMYRWENHVTPTYKAFLKPHKKSCDLVVPNNEGGFDRALEVICSFLKAKVNSD